MFALTDQERDTLETLGERLRTRRRAFGGRHPERQADFAARIGVSTPTYRKMEQGAPTVHIGYWVRAFRLLGALDELEGLLQPRESLFDQLDADRGRGRYR